jgi:hypothetical protein
VGHLRTLGWLAAGVTLLAALALPASGAGAQDGAVIRLAVPLEEIDESAGDVAVEVFADNVEDLAAFQFVLTFDADVLEFKEIAKGPFLTSSGREESCNPVTVQGPTIRYSCFTLRMEPAGPDGSGLLATVHFDPKGSGTSPLSMSLTKLINTTPDPIAHTAQDGEITIVGGDGGTLKLVLIIAGIVAAAVVVVGGGFAFMRRRSASPRNP